MRRWLIRFTSVVIGVQGESRWHKNTTGQKLWGRERERKRTLCQVQHKDRATRESHCVKYISSGRCIYLNARREDHCCHLWKGNKSNGKWNSTAKPINAWKAEACSTQRLWYISDVSKDESSYSSSVKITQKHVEKTSIYYMRWDKSCKYSDQTQHQLQRKFGYKKAERNTANTEDKATQRLFYKCAVWGHLR